MESLAAQLMEAFALALALPPGWFTEKMAGHCSALRVLCVRPLSLSLPPVFNSNLLYGYMNAARASRFPIHPHTHLPFHTPTPKNTQELPQPRRRAAARPGAAAGERAHGLRHSDHSAAGRAGPAGAGARGCVVHVN